MLTVHIVAPRRTFFAVADPIPDGASASPPAPESPETGASHALTPSPIPSIPADRGVYCTTHGRPYMRWRVQK